MNAYFHNKSILVTGSSGTVGSELIRQLLRLPVDIMPRQLIGIDNNESALFFQDQEHLSDEKAKFFVADVREFQALDEITKGVDIIFHCAALKHVVLCERSPDQAVQTNILGIQNVINASLRSDVEKVIFTSSDKAVNPTNVMGTTKLMGERMITAANSNKKNKGPIFASTRFGNVLGSSGSVIPIFYNQISQGGPVTLTDVDMTRFVMSIEGAVELLLNSAIKAKGGEVFITKMPVINIKKLAEAMINELSQKYGYDKSKVKIKEIGCKPGEKLYEELMSDEETRRSVELEQYFSVLPAFRSIYTNIGYEYDDMVSDNVVNPYISASEKSLSVNEIQKMLKDFRLLDTPEEQTNLRYWPGDKEEKIL